MAGFLEPSSSKLNTFKIHIVNFTLIIGQIVFFFWLHWVFVAAHRLSLVAVSGGYSSLRCAGFSITVASLVAEHRLWARGLQ